jgi:hypothetical protein
LTPLPIQPLKKVDPNPLTIKHLSLKYLSLKYLSLKYLSLKYLSLKYLRWFGKKKYAPFVIQKNNLTIAYLRRTQPHFATIGAPVRSSILLRLEIFKGFGVINDCIIFSTFL